MVMLNAQSPGIDSAAIAVFGNHELADGAVRKLATAHYDITKITVVGRGFHTEENVQGFFNIGDRVGFWGTNGAIWGGLWGLLAGGLFLTIPAIGPIVVVGHLAAVVVAAVEGAFVVGGLSALGAALYSIGIPKDSVLRYEKAVKADGFLVVVHGSTSDVERAHAILQQTQPSVLDIHDRLKMAAPASA